MGISTKYRSNETENIDDFAMKGDELREALDKIAQINQLLGGNKLTLRGVRDLIETISKSNEITIVDVGCGNGDMLRILADFGLKNKLKLDLIGIDANSFTVHHARKLSENYSNISFRCEDIFDESFNELKYDMVLCTLTLHHFKDDEIIRMLNVFNSNANVGIIINDLHRHAVAYRLFQALCFVFRLNDMSREDGLTSILKGFKKRELVHFSERLNFNNYKIQWKWAFRYQWIISKT